MAAAVGRDEELAAVRRLLAEGAERYVALVFEGEPGIGKTTAWREAVRLAEERGFLVLACRPAEAEAKLAFASLADLLGSVHEDAFVALPEPQRHALEAALLKRDAGGRTVDRRAIATALTTVITCLADAGPVLIAVDDAQWLDRGSAAALSFAIRRVRSDSNVAVFVATRTEPDSGARDLGLHELPPDRLERVRLGPLSLSALYHILKERLASSFSRPVLERIHRASGGNPLFALELASALVEVGGRPKPGEELPVPQTLAALLRERVAKLPLAARESLLAAALLPRPTISLVERAVGASAPEGLAWALEAGVIELREENIRFTHPLLASTVASSALPAARRAVHDRLSEVVSTEEERAMHAALAAVGPDEGVAARVEEAAALADRRGAPEDAAELLELALRLTPPRETAARARRAVELARVVGRAGDTEESTRLLDVLLRNGATGPIRARALELRAQIHWVAGTAEEAEECCEEALEHADDDDAIRARVLVTRARVSTDRDVAGPRAKEALAFVEGMDQPDPAVLSEALLSVAGHEWTLGRGLPGRLIERALELERLSPSPDVANRIGAALGFFLKQDGDFDGARRWLARTRDTAIAEGDEGSLPHVLSHLPQLELWAGNWAASEAWALEHLEVAERTRQPLERLTAMSSLAIVHAHQGRVDEARAEVHDALIEAEQADPWNEFQLLGVLGFIDLSVGHHDKAVESLRRAFEIYESAGSRDAPAVFENYSEALVVAGDLETAAEVVDLYERRARATRRALTLAPALRSRALLFAARQELDAAAAALDEAIAQHERVAAPFSHARTLLAAGQVRRRRGERRAAQEALGQALGIFEELGAPLWAERARAELRRIPVRRAAASDRLTPTEERVAALVADGHTNREVAQALFVTEKTVEANLTRIYRKLGVRSRSALAAQIAGREAGGVAPKP